MANAFDASEAPTEEPKVVVSGDFVQWKRTDLTDFDNTLYTLTYSLRSADTQAQEVEITAVASGNSDYLVQLTSAVTGAWTKHEKYYWQAYITRISDSSRITIDTGEMYVTHDYATDSHDPRTHAQIMLNKIESLIEGRADNDVDNYTINGRQITKMSVSELMEWRSYYRAEVEEDTAKLARRDGKPSTTSFQVRFS